MAEVVASAEAAASMAAEGLRGAAVFTAAAEGSRAVAVFTVAAALLALLADFTPADLEVAAAGMVALGVGEAGMAAVIGMGMAALATVGTATPDGTVQA